MPKCRATINGWSGLQELQALQRHFEKKHGIVLALDQAAEVRVDIENGHEPKAALLRCMLGTSQVRPADKRKGAPRG